MPVNYIFDEVIAVLNEARETWNKEGKLTISIEGKEETEYWSVDRFSLEALLED